MDFVSLLAFAGILALTASSPGPSIAALVARVMARGPRDVLPFLLAFWIGEVVWLTSAILGLAALAETFHTGFLIIRYLGIAYLIWLAIRLWRAPVGRDAPELPRPRSAYAMFGAGMALTLGNPKIMVFYVALLPSLIDLGAITLADWALLSLVTVLVLASVNLIWVGLAARARRLFQTVRAQRLINRVSAVTLGGAAGAMAVRSA